jgi:hypothetical protein
LTDGSWSRSHHGMPGSSHSITAIAGLTTLVESAMGAARHGAERRAISPRKVRAEGDIGRRSCNLTAVDSWIVRTGRKCWERRNERDERGGLKERPMCRSKSARGKESCLFRRGRRRASLYSRSTMFRIQCCYWKSTWVLYTAKMAISMLTEITHEPSASV